MKAAAGLAVCFVAALYACGDTPPSSPEASAPASSSASPATARGLSGDDAGRFYHLAEGSEVYPLSWMRALTDKETGRPFIGELGRYGLIADPQGPNNPEGLPIGLTADVTRDLRFSGTRMVGVNCAACHVADLTRNGQHVARIDGAPNLFDLSAFYGGLAQSTIATFKDLGELWAFIARVKAGSDGREESSADPTAALTRERPRFEEMLAASSTERALAAELRALHRRELARPVASLGAGLPVASRNEAAAVLPWAASPDEFEANARRVMASSREESAPVLPPGVPEAERREGLKRSLADFVTTIRLLKARAEFIIRLATTRNVASTPPGRGRVDAFGGARNLLFPAQAKPTTAPICYPHLWDIARTSWYHWDGSTASLLERNVGQALGLGAIFDRTTHASTVNVANIEELERLAGKIAPPSWPAAFGAPDAAKAQRGGAIFAARCAACHSDPPAGTPIPDRLYALDVIRTDPRRALNFAEPVAGTPFDEAISPVLKDVIRAAGAVPRPEKEWRVTKKYAGRPLVAVWATAPYLHNGSVPTIDDLLRPAAQRPKSFPVCGSEYDPVKLGLAGAGGQPGCMFDTSLTGNGNRGHEGPEYGTDLTADQRADVIEFLKK